MRDIAPHSADAGPGLLRSWINRAAERHPDKPYIVSADDGGSTGPDLTIVSGRYSARDLLEKVCDPNKAISDQYAAMIFTLTDGRVVTGRIVNYHGDNMMVLTNMLDPNGLVNVNKNRLESIVQSKVSMMPTGLLDTFTEDEILDLVAYLLSRGDRSHKWFQ